MAFLNESGTKLYRSKSRDGQDRGKTKLCEIKIKEVIKIRERSIPYSELEIQVLKQYYPITDNREMVKLLPTRDIRSIVNKAYSLGIKKTNRTWNEQETEKLIQLVENKCSMDQIIAHFNGKKSDCIRKKLKKLGLSIEYKKWQDDEFAILAKYGSKMNSVELKKFLPNRSESMISYQLNKIGVKKENKLHNSLWTKEEDNEIIDLYKKGLTIEDILRISHSKRSKRSIQRRLTSLGIASSRREWTKDEIKYLENYYHIFNPNDIARYLNRSKSSIVSKALGLGLKGTYYWSKEEENFLANNWMKMTDAQLAKYLHKNIYSISNRRKKMGYIRVDPNEKNYKMLSQYLRANTKWWIQKSKDACGNVCIFSGSNNFDVHHLYSVSSIIKDVLSELKIEAKKFDDYSEEELSLILNKYENILNTTPLGVCLRRDIHREFHSIFGYGHNTPEQFKEFKHIYQKTHNLESVTTAGGD